MQTSISAVTARCPSCAWEGPRLKRGGKLPAHKRERTYRERMLSDSKRATASTTCDGPGIDVAMSRALGAAFYAAGTSPMPSDRSLTCTAPLGMFGAAEIYPAAPPWARYIVTVHAPLSGPDAPHVQGERRTVAQFFATRPHAEEWARACSLLIGAPGTRAEFGGYVALGALDRRMKRWEALASCYSRRSRSECGLESPYVYTVIDPGGVTLREGAIPAGYGDEPSRSLWDRLWS